LTLCHAGTLRCATLLLYDFDQVTRCVISHTYRRFRHPSAALQKAFKIVAKQIALGSNQLLRASATLLPMAHYRKPLAAAAALNTAIFVLEAIAGLKADRESAKNRDLAQRSDTAVDHPS
jgi:hypothetical protein